MKQKAVAHTRKDSRRPDTRSDVDILDCAIDVDTSPIDRGGRSSHFVRVHTGSILCSPPRRKLQFAGRFRLYYADLDAAAAKGVSARDVLRANANTVGYVCPLLRPQGDRFSPGLVDFLQLSTLAANVLILDRIGILPPFRGREVALIVTAALIEQFGPGAAVAGMKPYPLQFEPGGHDVCTEWESELQLGSLLGSKQASVRMLRKYYERAGFARLPGSAFMFRNILDRPARRFRLLQ